MAAIPPHLASGVWVFDVIRSVQRGPGPYLGAETTRALETYLAGCLRGRKDSGRGDDWSVLQEFRSWLVAKGHMGGARVTPSMGFVQCIEVLDPSDRNVHTCLRFFREFANEIGVEPPL